MLIDKISMLIQPYEISQEQLPDVHKTMLVESNVDFRIFVKDVEEASDIGQTDIIRYRKCNEKPPFYKRVSHASRQSDVDIPILRHENGEPVLSLFNDPNRRSDRTPITLDDISDDTNIMLHVRSTDVRTLVIRRVLDSIRGYIEVWADSHKTEGFDYPVGDTGRIA